MSRLKAVASFVVPALCLAWLLVCGCLGTSAAQRSGGAGSPSMVELTIRLTDETSRPLTFPVRVQLLNGYGMRVEDGFSNDRGAISFRVSAGNYKVRVGGVDVEETTFEPGFTVYPRESGHLEMFAVKLKRAEDAASAQGNVSVAELNVPDKARNEFSKGMEALAGKRYVDAEKRLRHATEIYPRYAAAFNSLGVVAMNTGKPAEGKALFEKAIEADREHPAAYVNLAKVLLAAKDFPHGEALLTKCTTLDPMNPEALSLLAYFQLEQREFDLAIASARKVHNLPHAKYSMAHYIAATALEAKQDAAGAISEYQLFLKESPDSPSSQQVRKSIASLEARVR